MKECYGEKFILNNEIKDITEFNNKYLKSGKSLYEVMRIINGVPIFLEDHLLRLYNSSKMTGLRVWMEKEEIKDNIKKLCYVNNNQNVNVKIIFNYNKGIRTFLAYFIESEYPTEDMYIDGVKTSLYCAERENPNIKIINQSLRDNTNKIIENTGVYEVILVNKDGYITEGSRSNIFMIHDGQVITSPIGEVLPGITRKYVIKACINLGYKVIEKRINYKNIDKLQGLFISSTSPKVLPICKVDNIEFDAKNEMIQNIRCEYNKILDNYVKNNI
ncbi:aminotransferase class IV [Clostridium botulinum C]|nr:aminotransferase class IV [Clostridium botulinum]MCD3216645.1 aminotransferase class IV [Clostridium botulinum C]